MTSTFLTSERERRKRARFRLRPDLHIVPQSYEGTTCYVVKDPISLAYYRFDERDHFLLSQMDGGRTVEAVREAFERRFPPRRLSLEDLEAFSQGLLKAGLVEHELPQAGRQLYDHLRKRRVEEWLRYLTNVLYVEIPLADPDRMLAHLFPWVGWLFSRWFLAAAAVFMMAALLLVGTHFEALRARLPALHEFFSLRNLGYLWLAVGIVKLLHELGHGVTCKAFGGETHEMGVLFACLSPCLYFNVSDAWRLPDKWKRIGIGAAGIGAELLVASSATFLWWNLPEGNVLHHVCLNLMVVASVNTLLLNGNPLLRYDGYYVLADWLEVPNLRERSNRFLKNWVLTHCFGVRTLPEPPMTVGRQLLFVTYAILSYVYGWVVAFSAIWFLSQWLTPYKLGAISKLLAALSVASMVGWPIHHLVRGLSRRGTLPDYQGRRVAATLTVLAALVLGFFLVPLPVSRVRQTALVQLRSHAVQKVYVPVSSTLERLHVRDGDRVREGDLLAEFRSLELENELEDARGERGQRALQQNALRQQAAATVDAAQRARLETTCAQIDGERKVIARRIALLEKKLRTLVVRAPRAGVVLAAPRPEDVSKRWERDQRQPVCAIGDPVQLRALLPVTPTDYRLLQEDLATGANLHATVRVQGWDGHLWKGIVARLPESETREIPVPLTDRAGGPVAVRLAEGQHHNVPVAQQYLIAVDFNDAEAEPIWPGTLAQVKIHCRWRTTAWWLWRTVSSTSDLSLAG